MNSLRKTSLAAGVFYLLTFVSIPTLALYSSVRAPNFIVGPGPDTPVFVGAILEMIVALAGIGTRRSALPGGQATGTSARTGLGRIAHSGSRRDHRWHRHPPVDRDLAAGRGRSRCVGHRPGACCPVLLDVPLEPELHPHRERRPAWVPALPVAPSATLASRVGVHRSGSAPCRLVCRFVRAHRSGIRAVGCRRPHDRSVGVLAGRLPDLLGLQAIPNHGRHVTRFLLVIHHLGLDRVSNKRIELTRRTRQALRAVS